jgi:hypothetical protein
MGAQKKMRFFRLYIESILHLACRMIWLNIQGIEVIPLGL